MDTSLFKVHYYKIWSSLGDRIYIGSTEQDLAQRYAAHVYGYHKGTKCSSRILFAMYGVKNCQISLIESHWVSSKLEQRKLERLYYQMNFLDCVNKNRPYISDEERKKQHLDSSKKWYDENKQYKIHYSLSNYYKKRGERVDCPHCGADVCKLTLKTHMNSLKCKNHGLCVPKKSNSNIDISQLPTYSIEDFLEDVGLSQNQSSQ